MGSAFDELRQQADNGRAPDIVKRDLWAGLSLAAIAREWDVKPALIRRCRDELFAQFADPEAVKRAANGPLISAYAINRPRAKRSTARKERPVQIEMFS